MTEFRDLQVTISTNTATVTLWPTDVTLCILVTVSTGTATYLTLVNFVNRLKTDINLHYI
jgi:hypothetical protein